MFQNTLPLKVKVCISLDEDVYKGIKELANEDRRPFSQYVNLALSQHLEQEQEAMGIKPNKK